MVARSLEVDQLRSEKQSVEQQLSELRAKFSGTENRGAEVINKLRDSFQVAEKAVTERDEVTFFNVFVISLNLLKTY